MCQHPSGSVSPPCRGVAHTRHLFSFSLFVCIPRPSFSVCVFLLYPELSPCGESENEKKRRGGEDKCTLTVFVVSFSYTWRRWGEDTRDGSPRRLRPLPHLSPPSILVDFSLSFTGSHGEGRGNHNKTQGKKEKMRVLQMTAVKKKWGGRLCMSCFSWRPTARRALAGDGGGGTRAVTGARGAALRAQSGRSEGEDGGGVGVDPS